ncbi:MAG: glycosyltransferase family 4 protein [Candidatus Nealsonbacteria bacterium]|nr:glycosyltransferase family 4 protein [Candidatus Nealsonbacteria bacterium]
MRVCLVSDNLIGYHDTWSGAEMIVQYLENLLRKNGHQVSLLTVKSKKPLPEDNIFPVPLNLFSRFTSAFSQLRKIKPEAVHFFHTNSLFLPVMLACKVLGIPATFTVLDYWILCPTGHCLQSGGEICREREGKVCFKCVPPYKFLQRLLVRRLAKDLKYLVTFTETSKKRLVERGFPPEKIRVKYIYEFSFQTPEEKKTLRDHDILFVGTFRKQKGLDVVITALKEVVLKIPDARLAVIGRGGQKDKERIDSLVEKLGLAESIEFLGQKGNEEVLKIVSQANLVVVAEQWFSDFGPVALVEAMAQGAPVVSGDLGSPPDFIKHGFNGYLAKYNDPKSFAQNIIYLLENKEKAEEVGKNARFAIQDIFRGNREEEIINLYANNRLGKN